MDEVRDLKTRVERAERRIAELGSLTAFDASAVLIGLGIGIKAGANITLSKSGPFIVVTGSAGGGTNALLDAANHTDTVAQTVSRGSLIYGNATPKWDELVIGAANKVVSSDGADASWQYVEHEVSITIETPSAAEDIIVRKFKSAVTITAISAICVGGTSVTINPKHGTTTAGTDLLLTAPEVVASANTDGEQIGGTGTAMATTLSDVTLVAGEILRMVTTGISGTPTALHCTITYRLT